MIPFDDTPSASGVLRGSGCETIWKLTNRKSKTLRSEFLLPVILKNCNEENG